MAPPPGAGETDRRIVLQQGILAKQPNATDIWVGLGQLWVRKARESSDPGFYLNANAAADVALRIAPDDRLALDLRAMVLLNEHQFEAARALAQKIIARAPEDPIAYGTLSDALLELGRFDDAARAVQRMVDLKPNLPSYIRASYIHFLQGDTDGAIGIGKHAIDAGNDQRDPEPRAWALVQTALLFWHKGDVAGLDAGCDVALESLKDYPPALVGKARAAIARGDPKAAIPLLQASLTASPLAPTAWLLGDAKTLAGDQAGAIAAYAELERIGRLSDPRTLAAFYATKNRNIDQAIALATEEHKKRSDIYTEDSLAWSLYRAGKLVEACAAIDRATRLGTKDAILLYHLGAIRIAQGELEPGKKIVREALALTPKFDVTGAEEAAKLVAP